MSPLQQKVSFFLHQHHQILYQIPFSIRIHLYFLPVRIYDRCWHCIVFTIVSLRFTALTATLSSLRECILISMICVFYSPFWLVLHNMSCWKLSCCQNKRQHCPGLIHFVAIIAIVTPFDLIISVNLNNYNCTHSHTTTTAHVAHPLSTNSIAVMPVATDQVQLVYTTTTHFLDRAAIYDYLHSELIMITYTKAHKLN